MGFWSNKLHRTVLDDAEDLSYPPSGGVFTLCLLGVVVAIIPITYGVHCLFTGHTLLLGRRGSAPLELDGSSARALSIAYIAIGVFIHAHWCWGLFPNFETLSYLLKMMALIVFICSLGYTIYSIFA